MKKIFLATLLCVILISTLCLTTSCASKEERFNKAKNSFDNYTVDVIIADAEGGKFTTKLQIDNKKAKVVFSAENYSETTYYKIENGKVYEYWDRDSGWEETEYSSIEDASYNVNWFVKIFQQVYFDDFEEDGEFLKLKETSLEDYSKKLGENINLRSAKIILKNDKFESAIVVVQMGNDRCEIKYEFYDYGKTSVTLPIA